MEPVNHHLMNELYSDYLFSWKIHWILGRIADQSFIVMVVIRLIRSCRYRSLICSVENEPLEEVEEPESGGISAIK